jgi:thiol-disulfide isomerase/thioredoxin
MQKCHFTLILFMTGLLARSSCAWAQPAAPRHTQEIRKFTLTELEEYIRQCDHPLIVNFWATYCTPCQKEIPYLQTTVQQYKDKEVELLLVSLDPSRYYPTQITTFAQKTNIVSKLAWLNETNAAYFCPRIDKKWSGGIPASLFINNRTHFRQFFDRQLTDRQVEQQTRLLAAPGLATP